MIEMELITTFEDLSEKVLIKYDADVSVTMGILVADYRQTDTREYILNYLNQFDEKSGKFIDFYLPGYYMFSCESTDEWEKRSHKNISVCQHCSCNRPVYISRLDENYYFDSYLFDDFLREFEKKTGISYTYNPMLILVEMNKSKNYGMIEFQKKMIIELDSGGYEGVRRSGILFDRIFEIAKHEVGLDRFQKELRMYYLKGNAVNKIARVLEGEFILPLVETTEEILRYRIR